MNQINHTKLCSSFLLSISLCPFLISPTPPALPHQSPSLPEYPIILTGQVSGFDEDGTFPLAIKLVYNPFCCQDQSTETDFLKPDGRFGFRLANSIAQDYLLTYGDDKFSFLLLPGDSVHFTLRKNEEKPSTGQRYEYELSASRSITQRSIEWAAAARADGLHAALEQRLQATTSLDTARLIIEEMETRMRQQYDSLALLPVFQDSLLLEWARQEVAYRYKNRFLIEVMTRLLTGLPDEKAQLLDYQTYEPRDFPEANKSAYHSSYRRFIHHLEMLLWRQRPDREMLQGLQRERRGDEIAALRLAFMREHFPSFPSEMLQCQFFDLVLSKPLESDYWRTQIEQFIEATGNENFKRALSEKMTLHASIENLAASPSNAKDVLPDIIAANPGKVIVLDFWATWCAPCLDELKHRYPAFIRKFSPAEVAFVFLAADSPEKLWEKVVSGLDFEATHYLLTREQAAAAKAPFKVSAIPHHALIGKDGSIVRAKAPGPGEELEAMIRRFLANLD